MLRPLRKLNRYLLLAVFGALSASGPGLHYLPVFGLHADRCSTQVEAECGHGHEHDHAKSSANGSEFGVDLADVHRHDRCKLCDYYAQGNVVPVHAETLSSFTPETGEAIIQVGLLCGQRLTDHLARGPPLAAS